LQKILKKTGIKVIYDSGTLTFISVTGKNMQAAIDKFQGLIRDSQPMDVP
jgi:hypothetical protein